MPLPPDPSPVPGGVRLLPTVLASQAPRWTSVGMGLASLTA